MAWFCNLDILSVLPFRTGPTGAGAPSSGRGLSDDLGLCTAKEPRHQASAPMVRGEGRCESFAFTAARCRRVSPPPSDRKLSPVASLLAPRSWLSGRQLRLHLDLEGTWPRRRAAMNRSSDLHRAFEAAPV